MPSPVGNNIQGSASDLPLMAAGSTLSGMPPEIIHKLIRFNPDSVRILQVVSRELNRTGEDFLQYNAGKIVGLCSRANSPLYNLVYTRFINFSVLLWSQGNRFGIQFHLSIPEDIRSLGIPAADCPDKILSAKEISRFNERVQNNIQDVNLQKIWDSVRREIVAANRLLEGVPEVNAPASVIRTWMHTNQTLVQGISRLYLTNRRLTCIPIEAGLFTGLRTLFLAANQLHTIPEGTFQGLSQLQELNLCGNGLHTLQEGAFRGLAQLQHLQLGHNELHTISEGAFQGLDQLQQLSLNNNQLHTIPEGAFQGLVQLQQLYLNNNQLHIIPERSFQGLVQLQQLSLAENQLHSLPEESFQGLGLLQTLTIGFNQLGSLPEGLFQGLGQLQSISLYSNQLGSLPGGLFQGLGQLQQLSLGHNQLHTLAKEAFHGLIQLQKLWLYGNPRLLISWEDLPVFENNLAFREVMHEFFNYEYKSPLAALYQFAAGSASSEAIQQSFYGLAANIKNAIYGLVWDEAGRPNTDDPQWGEHHTFDHMATFKRALKRYVRDSFDALDSDQKNAVYGQVFHLAQSESGANAVDFDDPNWGGTHAFDIIPRLIDAMAQ